MFDATAKKAADAKRASTRKETIERHSRMQLLVRECRIRPNSQNKRDYLRRLFAEGRWYYNWLLQQYKDGKNKTISSLDTTDEFAVVLAPNGYEVRNLVALSSQMRQSIKKQLNANRKSLISNIKAGNCEHGGLHYKQSCDQIPLKAGKWSNDESTKNKAVTFSLNDKRTRVRLQGTGFALRLTGGNQIPRDAELADGKLVRRAGKYYLQVTFFVERDESFSDEKARIMSSADALSGKSFDFGIEKHVTDESGDSESWCFEESERLKAAQEANEVFRSWHERRYGWARSSQHQKRIIAEEYEKIRRQKKEAIDGFIGELRKDGGFIAVQDEQVRRWHADERYSDVVHHSIMGGLMARLKKESSTLVVGKWVRTTGVCPDCGHVLAEKPDLSVREWECPSCGVHHDRDEAAARVIGMLASSQLLYPERPIALSESVWLSLLCVLNLDVPAKSS